mmetsp:Transcript_6171/g.23310  ORF Transcript_6171/g.23310 Transcript_6171/m.23310 type:complete len:215 (+) Transcript_6171:3474-4118(+)
MLFLLHAVFVLFHLFASPVENCTSFICAEILVFDNTIDLVLHRIKRTLSVLINPFNDKRRVTLLRILHVLHQLLNLRLVLVAQVDTTSFLLFLQCDDFVIVLIFRFWFTFSVALIFKHGDIELLIDRILVLIVCRFLISILFLLLILLSHLVCNDSVLRSSQIRVLLKEILHLTGEEILEGLSHVIREIKLVEWIIRLTLNAFLLKDVCIHLVN